MPDYELQGRIRLTADTRDAEMALANISRGTEAGTQSLGRMGTGFLHLSRVAAVTWNRLEIAQLAVENSQIRLASAQDRLTYAIDRFGSGSRQAIEAQRNLEVATHGVEIAQQRENIRLLFFTLTVLPEAIVGISRLIGLKRLLAATGGGGFSDIIGFGGGMGGGAVAGAGRLASISRLAGPIGLAVGTAAAVGLAVWGMHQANQQAQDTTNIYANNINMEAPRSVDEWSRIREEAASRRRSVP